MIGFQVTAKNVRNVFLRHSVYPSKSWGSVRECDRQTTCTQTSYNWNHLH